jgi:hypothetical protein
VEFLWSDYQFAIGTDATLAGGPIQVDDGTFKRPSLKDIKVHAEETGSSDVGINAWIAENNLLAGRTVQEFGELIRSSNVSLGWKTNGFIDRNATIIKTSSGVEVPFEDIKVSLHAGLPYKDLFHSGVQVVKKGSKYQVFGYDYTNPFFKVNYSSRPSIAGKTTVEETFTYDGSNNTFKLNTFKVGQNSIDDFAVLVDGFKVNPQYITVKSSTSFIVIDPAMQQGSQVTAVLNTTFTNPRSRTKSFKVNDQSYFYYQYPVGNYIEYPYGHEFNSPQEVVEFMSDLGLYMDELGWKYEDDDWIGVAKRFALWSQTAKTGQIFVDVPNPNKIVLENSFGHLFSVSKLVYGGYSLLDIAGFPITEFETYRFDDRIEVTSEDQIFGLRAVIQDIQHAVFISNETRFSDLIYDPLTGLRQKRLQVNTQRTKEWAGRLETPGYVVSGQDLIPSFEKSTSDISHYYDMFDPVTNTLLRDQSFNIYGWYFRDYARDMNVNDTMALLHHRSAIREKGTSRAVKSFARSKANETPLEILECWAWKTGEFGRSPFDNPVRFSIDSSDFKKRIQSVIFGNTTEPYSITVSDYDRNETHPRWINPPRKENFKFPFAGGKPSDDYDVRVVILEDETVGSRLFHFDPRRGLHEPYAYAQIDIETSFDPAYYNNGTNTVDEGYEWGAEHVGRIWWNTEKRVYKDYLDPALSTKQASEDWGRLESSKVTNTRSVNTYFESTVDDGSVFDVDGSIHIRLKDGRIFRGIVLSINGNVIEYSIMSGPENISALAEVIAAEGIEDITKYEIEIYEWIESTVPPTQFASDYEDVLVYNSLSPSYTKKVRGDGKTRYYFWVKNRRAKADGKELSTFDMASRLGNPTSNLIPWFGVLSEDRMIFNASAINRRNDASIQIFTYPKNHQEHDQWALLVEKDQRARIDDTIVDHIVSSIQGTDGNGNPAPAAFRTELDKYGSELGQIVFSDITEAKRCFVNSLNHILKKYNRFSDANFQTTFPASAKNDQTNGFWNYQDFDILGYQPSQVVETIADRDAMIDLFVNDTVRVKNAFTIDSVKYYESYQWDGIAWNRVQARDGSVTIDNNFFLSFRTNVARLKELLSIPDFNQIWFDMIQEMMRQFENCSWCFKTSYVDIINTINVGQPTTQPFDETAVIEGSILDMKPYHTKIRRYTSSHIIFNGDDNYDEAQLSLSEEYAQKNTIFVDRLSCNLFDDNTYDCEPKDRMPYDLQTWERADLGTSDTTLKFTFDTVSDRKRVYVVPNVFPYAEYSLKAFNSDGNPSPVPLYSTSIENENLNIVFETLPPRNITFEVFETSGVATEALYTPRAIDDQFNTILSTYKHAKAIEGTECADLDGCVTCAEIDGGSPEERARQDIDDRTIITVTHSYTGAYGSYDTVPYDTFPYDSLIANSVDSVFTVNASEDYGNDSLSEVINLTVEKEFADGIQKNTLVAMDGRFTVGQVKINTGASWVILTEGEDYEIVEGRAIRLFDYYPDGTRVRLFAKTVQLKHHSIRITAASVSDYTIDDRTIDILETFAFGSTINVTYYVDSLEVNFNPLKIYNNHVNVVDDAVTDHTVYNGQSFLVSGYTVLNTTDDNIYTWNGSAWTSAAAPTTGYIYSNLEQQAYELTAGDWVETTVPASLDLDYNFLGLGSALSLGYTEIGKSIYEDGWRASQSENPPENDTAIQAWWSVNSAKAIGYKGDLFSWADVSSSGLTFTQFTDTAAPTFDGTGNNYVVFGTGDSMVSGTGTEIDGLFDTDNGNMNLILSVTSNTAGTLVAKTAEWSLAVVANIDAGAFTLQFSHEFDTTAGVWDIPLPSFALDTEYDISISYDGSNVANDPVVTIDGASITPVENVAPVGTASSTTNAVTVGGGAEFKIASLRLMSDDPQ